MNFIKEITYGTLIGGSKNGLIGFEVIFNGSEPDDKSASNLFNVVNTVIQHPASKKYKRIFFKGPYPSNDVMWSILAGFRSALFNNIISVDGQLHHPWMLVGNEPRKLVQAINVHLTKPDWPGYIFDELIYDLKDPASPEPYIPESYNGRAPFYLNPINELADPRRRKEIFDWIQRAKYIWNLNVISKPIKEYLFKEES